MVDNNKDTSHGAPQELISQTVDSLASLYNTSSEDTPDNVLKAYPNTNKVIKAQKLLIDALLPGRMIPEHPEPFDLKEFLALRIEEAINILIPELEKAIPFRWKSQTAQHIGSTSEQDILEECKSIVGTFCERLTCVRKLVIEDVKAAYEGDPATLNYAEIQLAYPGMLAIASHRLAHEFYKLNVPIIPRVMSEWVHSKTGVDIHPGATIGHSFFIDHATGVVIGETCKIGNHVKVYQGVTLGAKSAALEKGQEGKVAEKRHPTVEDYVVIYANATILGGNTLIGRGSTIGGNLFLTKSVSPNSFVVPKLPGVKIREHGTPEPGNYSI